MYQNMRLYEFSGSIKLLLTGFILAVCAAGLAGLAGLYSACKDADGDPNISFRDIKIFIRGAKASVLENAAEHPKDYGLGNVPKGERADGKEWCQNDAPFGGFRKIRRILKDTPYGRSARRRHRHPDSHVEKPGELAEPSDEELNDEYRSIRPLARLREPISALQLSVGAALYLSVASLVFLGLGMLFVRTSMFEKRKMFFVSSTFAIIAACPVFLYLALEHVTSLYLLLLSLLLLVVCFGVFALVSLFDIWFRRTVT